MPTTTFRENNYFLFEIFVFIRVTAQYTSVIAQNFLIQDKLCLFTYHQNPSWCARIEREQETLQLANAKDRILGESAQYANYIYILQCLPMFAWSLFVGSFLDRYKPGAKLLLVNCMLGDMIFVGIYILQMYFYSLAPIYLLLVATPYIFTGGLTSFLTAMYSYTIAHSTQANRSLKFVFLEVAMVMGLSMGSYLSGLMLFLNKPSTRFPQIRTYWWNFCANLLLDLVSLGLLWIIHRLDMAKKVRVEVEPVGTSEEQITNNNLDEIEAIPGDSVAEDDPEPFSLRLLFTTFFDFANIKSTFSCLIRSRPGLTRFQLYVLFLLLFFQIFVVFGMDGVLLPFAEKVYHWKPIDYSTYSSLGRIASTIFMAIGTSLLVKKFKVADEPLMIVAHVSAFTSYLSTGTFLNVWSYFIAIPIGAFNNFSIISLRSIISKIVDQDEVGKIFSVIATLESAIPMGASPVYANLFEASIGTFPGLIYQFSAGLMAISMVVAVFQELYFR